MPARYRGILVPHTHWDRAWYLSFPSYRHRLVRTLDRLLDWLAADPRFQTFVLDGQTILLQDYLDLRPDREPQLRELVENGRLAIGPWYTLPDLFLVSGEAIVRNLQRGRQQSDRFGGGTNVGYVPDPFGHCAQMPQILQGFGMDAYVFMRGLDAQTLGTHGSIFDWEAPDGSRVLAVYQPQGYLAAGALGHPHVFGRFEGHAPELALAKQQIEEAIAAIAPQQKERALLLSNGFDHMPPQPELPDLIPKLNAELDTVALELGTLDDYIAAVKAEAIPRPTYRGDLIGNAEHPILASVFSTRLYLKQQNHLAQTWLARYAEPLSAWLEAIALGEDVRPFLDLAWELLLQNHPHDDICGCSVDSVHLDNEYRYRQVEQMAETIAIEHLEQLWQAGFVSPLNKTSDRAAEVFVFNPHPFSQTYRVTTEILFPNPKGEWGEPTSECQLLGRDGNGREIAIASLKSEGRVVRSRFLETTWGRRYEIEFAVDLPPLGYQLVRIGEGKLAESKPERDRPFVLENETYRVAVENDALVLTEKATGVRLRDVLRYEYQLDGGDTYSFSPVPEFEPVFAAWKDVHWHCDRPDTLCLTHHLTVPESYEPQSGPRGETTLQLQTEISLIPQRAIAVTTTYENTAKNGRLRAVFATGLTTRISHADGHFCIATREKPHLRTPESDPECYRRYPGELDYPTHHQGDFAIAGGANYSVWVANRGLPEYELLDPESDTHIAVTLHRAVGYLSVENGRIRRCQAGPSVPTPEAQCLRLICTELAWGLGGLETGAIARLARAFSHPAWVREMPYLPYLSGEGMLPRTTSLLAIDNPNVVLSALKPAATEGRGVLRLFNQTDSQQAAIVQLGFPVAAWCSCDLREIWSDRCERAVENGAIALSLRPHQILTILLQFSL